MDARQMRDVAMFVTSYPTPDVSFNLDKGKYTAGPITLLLVMQTRILVIRLLPHLSARQKRSQIGGS
ncbi:hypothetical protein DFJ58DRAFT_341120 [Suillus subalutaceus]|uniref:uncharacterized protein n=1 Tax=Suillus subalutaceus TaxID=48586 RepID=UPI001B87048D|nr:uncharacterized protein DFJ58DRAFT_341120 [Suillus subalutaceus]KAG1856343.1 hypothetical protein DFJ58DRAFT_341120 [Suillus subalutaceus]